MVSPDNDYVNIYILVLLPPPLNRLLCQSVEYKRYLWIPILEMRSPIKAIRVVRARLRRQSSVSSVVTVEGLFCS